MVAHFEYQAFLSAVAAKITKLYGMLVTVHNVKNRQRQKLTFFRQRLGADVVADKDIHPKIRIADLPKLFFDDKF